MINSNFKEEDTEKNVDTSKNNSIELRNLPDITSNNVDININNNDNNDNDNLSLSISEDVIDINKNNYRSPNLIKDSNKYITSEINNNKDYINQIDKEEFDSEINENNYSDKSPNKKYKIDEIINSSSILNSFNLKIYTIILLIIMVDGSESSLVSFLVPILDKEWKFTTFTRSFFGVCTSLGGFIAGLISGNWSDTYGRKPLFIIGNIVGAICSLLASFSTRLLHYAIFRITYGFGIGVTINAASALTTEITSKKKRAWMLNVIWVFYPVGELYSSILADYFLVSDDTNNITNSTNFKIYNNSSSSFYNNTLIAQNDNNNEYSIFNDVHPWRKLMISLALPFLITSVLGFLISESPRFLLNKQKYSEAFKVINKILIANKKEELTEDEKETLVKEQKEIITHFNLNNAKINKSKSSIVRNYKQLLSKKYFRVTFCIAIIYYVLTTSWNGLSIIMPKLISDLEEKHKIDSIKKRDQAIFNTNSFNNSSIENNNVVNSTSTNTFFNKENDYINNNGLSDDDEILNNKHTTYYTYIISAIFEIPFTLLASYLAEMKCLGRKGSLTVSFVLSIIPTLILVISHNITGFSAYFIIIRFLTTIPYGIIYIYNNEVYPTKIRSTSLGFLDSCNRVFSISSSFISFFLYNINYTLPFIYVSSLFILGAFMSWLLPYETLGKNIE